MGSLSLPQCLRPNVSKGYSQRRGSNIVRQQPQGGIFRQTKRFGTEPVPFTVTFTVDGFGRQVFYDFYDNDLDNGRNSFPMTLDSANGLETHQCWIASNVSESTSTATYWDISFEIMAESTPTQLKPFGGDLSALAREYESTKALIDTLNGLGDLVENYFPLGNS
jgi:hypothetical protein